MDFEEEESSADGSLNDILFDTRQRQQTIPRSIDVIGTTIPSSSSSSSSIIPSSSSIMPPPPASATSASSSSLLSANRLVEYVPSCLKLTDLLSDYGFVMKLSLSDIDEKLRTISVFVIDAWAESVLNTVSELNRLLKSRETVVTDASLSNRRDYATVEALESRVSDLQQRLYETERKLATSDAQRGVIEEERDQSNKKIKGLEADIKKSVKNFDMQLQECERRVRQRDAELERLKAKLQSLSTKERSTEEKHKQTLSSLRQGDISFESRTSSTSSRSGVTPASPCSAPRSTKSFTGLTQNNVSVLSQSSSVNSPARGATPRKSTSKRVQPPSPEDAVQALEAERAGLKEMIEEMNGQILELTRMLKVQESNNGSQKPSVDRSASNRRRPVWDAIGFTNEGADDSDDDLADAEKSAKSGTAREMLDKLDAQKRRIEQLEHRCESYKRAEESHEELVSQMRSRAAVMREEIENLRLELDNRPTMRQWTQKQTELQDLEDKLHDLVMMRGEAAEIAAWRQHLSTRDRIKVDKRNYELGLWLLDSLPKAVAKEILQGVCRELDVSDVSEVINSIVKLKTVVKTVPRMDRFISQVCAFLFQRDPTILASMPPASSRPSVAAAAQPTMEDVMPVLKRWWLSVQRGEQLEAFTNKIFAELRRRERLLISSRSAPDASNSPEPSVSNDDDLLGRFDSRVLWAQRDMEKGLELIRDMCDFQVEVMRHNKSFQSAEKFIHEHPEQLTSRLLGHLQYLFQVPSLEGLLPRLNQVYIFHEEMKNFLSIMREVLGLPAGTSDTVLLAEIQNHATRIPKF